MQHNRTKKKGGGVSNLVFYAQSTSTVNKINFYYYYFKSLNSAMKGREPWFRNRILRIKKMK